MLRGQLLGHRQEEDERTVSLKVARCEPSSLFEKSKVVSLRWDVLRWGLVFDMDVALSESQTAPLYRAWLVYSGISDMSLPIGDCRMGLGFAVHGFYSESVDGWIHSSFGVLIRSMNPDGAIKPEKPKRFGIKS